MTRIAHVTDLHFGAADPVVVEALVGELNALSPDLVVVSGDFTQGAHAHEFAEARAFLDRLRAPVLAVPGNHDISPYDLVERFFDPYARYRRYIAADTQPIWRDARVAVVGLNSAGRMRLHWDWSRGRITWLRLRRLVSRLRALPPELVRIVVTHHPLLPPEGLALPVATGAAAALRAMAANGVALVLAGHLHRGYSRTALPDGRPPLILQGATATSTRLRGEPNAFNLVTVDAAGAIGVDIRIWTGAAWTGGVPAPAAEEVALPTG